MNGSLFEDSLELGPTQLWTPGFLAEFARRRGYSLRPYLPILAADINANPFGEPVPLFDFAGEDATIEERVRRDVDQTFSDLYLELHLEPMRQWARSRGLAYRAQPYGEPIDLARASAQLDIAECESLACAADDWRAVASGSAMAGHELVSDELLPGGFGADYSTTPRDLIELANDHYALGANQLIVHGFAYAHWPSSADGSIFDDHTLWPGYEAFAAGIGEPFGPRQPSWGMARDTSGYLARTQLGLQTGEPRTDIAIYNQSLGHVGVGWDDPALAAAGYSYGYVSPGALELPSAEVRNRRLAPDGPAFRALIVDEQESMPIETARTLRALASDGLLVIIVGDPPFRVPGYAASGAEAAAADRALRDAIDALLDQPSVARVATAAEVPTVLTSFGVPPAATSTASAIDAVHRVGKGIDLYLLRNPSTEPVDATVSLRARRGALPYELDAWHGEVTPLAQFRVNRGRVRTRLSFSAGDTRLIAIAARPWARQGRSRAKASARKTSADAVLRVHGKLVARSASAGSDTTVLSNGRRIRTTVGALPPPHDVRRWDLTVDEYRPPAPGYPSSHTDHVDWEFEDVELRPWAEIPGISDAVGVGTYVSRVDLTDAWRPRIGAYLELGSVGGSVRIRVNGRSIGPINPLAHRIDIGRYLKPGGNRLEIEVATTLLNRLRTFRPAEYATRAKQEYGLLGPVTVTPYADVPLTGAR